MSVKERNKPLLERIMQKQKLLVTKNMRLRACRTPMKANIKDDHLNQFWGIDMTKIKLLNWG
jgi:hypothetical protein